jgi:hypothetical protein
MTGQLSLKWQGFKDKINPAAFFDPPKYQERQALRSHRKEKKEAEHQQKTKLDLDKQIQTGSIDKVKKDIILFCSEFEHIIEFDRKAIHDELTALSELVNSQVAVIQKAKHPKSKIKQESNDSAAQLLSDMIGFEKISEGVLRSAQAHNSFTMLLSDEKSLNAEITHLLDAFNLQSATRKIWRLEKKLGQLEEQMDNPKNMKKFQKLTEDEKKELKALRWHIQQTQALFSKLLDDEIKKMQVTLQNESKVVSEILSRLQEWHFPLHELEIVRREIEVAYQKTEAAFKDISNEANGATRIIESAIAKNK